MAVWRCPAALHYRRAGPDRREVRPLRPGHAARAGRRGPCPLRGRGHRLQSLYRLYLRHLQVQAWSGSSHLSLLSQGQGYVQLIGSIGLLVVLPLGLTSLMLQGLLIHQPVQRSGADTVRVITSTRTPRPYRLSPYNQGR